MIFIGFSYALENCVIFNLLNSSLWAACTSVNKLLIDIIFALLYDMTLEDGRD